MVSRVDMGPPDALYRHRAEKAERELAALRVEHEKALASARARVTTEEAELHAFAQRIMLAWVEGQQRTLDMRESIQCYEAAARWLAIRTELVAEGSTLTMYANSAREAAALALARWGADRWERVPDDANGRILGTHRRVPADGCAASMVEASERLLASSSPAPEDAAEKIKHSEALDDEAK